jgi:hypothetical protein
LFLIAYTNKAFSGSTATIIRLPYTWTLKEYKGDFLFRTTDFALWTTVEVGVGITAGCMATLKPLLKSGLAAIGIHSTSPLSSGMPWSKAGRKAPFSEQAMDDLRPMQGKAITTTTVTGRGGSSDSEEEVFLTEGARSNDVTKWELAGINKAVTTTVTEERNESEHQLPSHSPRHVRTRSQHGSGDSSSTCGDGLDEESRKAAKVYERF